MLKRNFKMIKENELSARIFLVFLVIFLGQLGCARTISSQEEKLIVSSAEKEHAVMLSALASYKDRYGYFPLRKELLIEEHLCPVSSLPPETEYLAQPLTKSCKSAYEDEYKREDDVLKKAVACARTHSKEKVINLELSRRLCPEYFMNDHSRTVSLEAAENCALGAPAFRLLRPLTLNNRSVWLLYSSDSHSWTASSKQPKLSNKP